MDKNLEYINFDCNAWLTIRFEYDLRSRKNMEKSPKMECSRKGHTRVRITYDMNMLKHISSCNISILSINRWSNNGFMLAHKTPRFL